MNTNPKNEKELDQFFAALKERANDLGVEVVFGRENIHDAEHLNCVWYGGDIGYIKYKGYTIIISASGDISLSGFINGEEFGYRDKNNSGRMFEECGQILNDARLEELLDDGHLEYISNNWFEFNLITPTGEFMDMYLADNILSDNILDCFAGFEDYFAYVDEDIKGKAQKEFNTEPKNEEELMQVIEALHKKAEKLGVGLDFTRADIRDEKHLNCFWYGGVVGTIKYKNYIIEISARGEIRLSGTLDGRYFEAVDKRGNGDLFFDIGRELDDYKLEKLIHNGDIYVGDGNWFEVNLIGPEGNFIDLSGSDNVLDDNILECFANFEDYFEYVDSIINQAGEGKEPENMPEDKPKEVYAVVTSWATEDDIPDLTISLYATYDLAKTEFDRVVKREKIDGNGYDSDGNLKDDFEIEEESGYFEVWLSGRYSECFTKIEIKKLVIGEE